MALAISTRAGDDAGIAGRVKESVYAALLTLVLCIPIILFRAEANQNDGTLELIWRPVAVAVLVSLAFVGRFLLLTLAAAPKRERAATVVKPTSAVLAGTVTFVGLGFLLLFPPLAVLTLGASGSLKWIDSYGIQILIYVMLGWGLNIVVGLAGLLDLGYVAFYAVGA